MSDPKYTALEVLSILAQGRPERVKLLAEPLIDVLDPIVVVQSRTGLVMLPYTDTARGATFHLGEVMAAEAHIRVRGAVEGYGVCMGRDLELAMALAIIDAALHWGEGLPAIYAVTAAEEAHLVSQDEATLRDVAATRVEMETF